MLFVEVVVMVRDMVGLVFVLNVVLFFMVIILFLFILKWVLLIE